MGRDAGKTMRTVGATALLVLALLTAVAPTTLAQDEPTGTCTALTTDALRDAIGGDFSFTGGTFGICGWEGTTADGQPVTVQLIAAPGLTLDDMRAEATGGQDVSVLGLPAYLAIDDSIDPPMKGILIEVGDQLLTVGIVSPVDVDLSPTLQHLGELAVGRIAAGPVGEPPPPPVASERGDPCELFSAEEVSSLLGTTVTASSSGNGCTWGTAPESADFASVSVAFDNGNLQVMRGVFPGGQDIEIAGQPAYQSGSSQGGFSQSSVSVDLGPETVSISLASIDPQLDADAIAVELMTTALGRGLEVLPEPAGQVVLCAAATGDDIADALAVTVRLGLQDLDTLCMYEGGTGTDSVFVSTSTLDVATLPDTMAMLGATEVDGPGDRDWWLPDAKSLYSQQGDLAVQVQVVLGMEVEPATLQEMATAVMTLVLGNLAAA